MRGKLIAIEGIDGAGKGTQVERLAARLRADGHEVITTREPTAGPHGATIRARSTAGESVPADEQLELFMADRAEHVDDLIAPALARGAIVITDRYYLSNVAYQGAGGLDPDDILARNEARFPKPDLAIVIEVSPETALARIRARGEPLNQAFEREDFLGEVADIYAKLTCPYVARVDGSANEDVVHADIMGLIAARVAIA